MPLELPAAWENLFHASRKTEELPAAASSVLATVVIDGPDVSFLFTRRTKTMSAFAGHLSFPGGRIDPEDATPLDTALRETEEEIGLTRGQIRVLGHFTELDTHFGTLVICYAGAMRPHDVPTTPTSPREVAEIIRVPITSLLRPGTVPISESPGVYVATKYEARRIGSPHMPSRTLHYWTLEHGHEHERTILWGLTAEIVARFLKAAYAWTSPGPTRAVEDMEELQP